MGVGVGVGSEGSTLPAAPLPPLRAPEPVLTAPGANGRVRPRPIEALGRVRARARFRVRVSVRVRVGVGARVRVGLGPRLIEALVRGRFRLG